MKISRTKVENVTVSTSFAMHFAGAESDEPIAATLTYNAYEPFSVTAGFMLGDGASVKWVMARDLLREGVVLPTGLGDVRVLPIGDLFMMELNSPNGRAVLQGPIAPVIDFVARIFRVVPEGKESEYFSIDAELDLLSDLYAPRDKGLDA